MIGGRSAGTIARAAISPEHYTALRNMFAVYDTPLANLARYLTGRGRYPYDCVVATPDGKIAPRLFTHHDLLTVNEVFCRLDYATAAPARVVVDVGANIGISSLYFVSASPEARVYAFEPVSANVRRFRHNLAPYGDRVVVEECAVVPDEQATVSFGVEPTGRYGGVGAETGTTVVVPARSIASVVEQVLTEHDSIDLLKLDVEGLEIDLATAVPERCQDRIGSIFIEAVPTRQLLPRFRQVQRGGICRLTRGA